MRNNMIKIIAYINNLSSGAHLLMNKKGGKL